MGLMDRDYMNRTPEEREAEYKSKMSEERKQYSPKNNSSIVPIVIFIVVLILIVLTFYFNPDLANFSIWN